MFYLSHRINKEIKEIYEQTFFLNLALALVFIFEPIYLYTLSHSLVHVMWFYVQVYAWYLLWICFGAKFASEFGYKHSMFVSNLFYIVYWLALYFIAFHSILFYIAPILFALQKSFFWPAYDADIALYEVKKQRGRELGILFSVQEAGFIVAPFLGGLVSAFLGFLPLFILAGLIMFLSIIPLFDSPEIFSKHEFRLKNLWQEFRDHKWNFLGYWGYAEDLMVMTLWPIYIFIAIPQVSYVGLLSAIAMLLTIVIMLYIGKKSDQENKQFLVERNAIFYGFSWFVRILAQGIPFILLFDVLTKTLKSLVTVPMIALTFEIAGDQGADHAIAYAVFYEVSLAVGKIFTALLAIWILSLTGNIYLVFGFVGILTMFYGLLRKSR